MAHCDTVRVDESDVRAVVAPPYTDTWHPISHGDILDTVKGALDARGMQIQHRDYSLSPNGKNMFAVWRVDTIGDLPGMAWSVGIRNSLQKQFAVGICAGTYVFVCDNMAFSGDFVQLRKHTNRIDDDLPRIAEEAIEKVQRKLGVLSEWQFGLREFAIEEPVMKLLVFDAMATGIFAPSKFRHFLNCWEEENKDGAAPHTMYAYHGAVTRLIRGESLFKISETSTKLVTQVDQFIETTREQAKTDSHRGLMDRLRGIKIF